MFQHHQSPRRDLRLVGPVVVSVLALVAFAVLAFAFLRPTGSAESDRHSAALSAQMDQAEAANRAKLDEKNKSRMSLLGT